MLRQTLLIEPLPRRRHVLGTRSNIRTATLNPPSGNSQFCWADGTKTSSYMASQHGVQVVTAVSPPLPSCMFGRTGQRAQPFQTPSQRCVRRHTLTGWVCSPERPSPAPHPHMPIQLPPLIKPRAPSVRWFSLPCFLLNCISERAG